MGKQSAKKRDISSNKMRELVQKRWNKNIKDDSITGIAAPPVEQII